MRAKNKKLLVACCAVACGSLFVGGYAMNDAIANADATNTTTPIVKATATVDGVIDDAYLTSYKVEAATADLIKIQSSNADPSVQSISYYALHDDDNLYVAAKITTAENAWDGTTTDTTSWAWKNTDAAELRVKFANDDQTYGFLGDYQAKFKSSTGDYAGGYDYKAKVVDDTTYIVEFKVPFTDANKGQNLQITVQADDYGSAGFVGAYAKEIEGKSGSDSRMPVNADVLSVDVAPVEPEPEESVEIKEGVDATTGKEWEGNYGADGYIVMGAGGIYSNMYTGIGVDAKTLYTSGQMGTYRYWPKGNTSAPDTSDEEYAIDESAPISQWGAVVPSVMNSGHLSDYTLYAPNSTEKNQARFHNTWGTAFIYGELSMWFKVDTDNEFYFTVNVADWSKKVSSTNKIAADLYKRDSGYKGGYITSPSNMGATCDGTNMEVTVTDLPTFNDFYGEGKAPVASQVVEAQTSYVTYKIQGAGFYQLVLRDATLPEAKITFTENANNSGTYARKTPNITNPMINGFFFDYVETKYSITYNGVGEDSGITMPDNYVTQYLANSTESLPVPTKQHATFDGWYDAEVGGNKVESLADKAANLSLWPRFNNIEWTASYDFGSYEGKVYLDEAKTQELTETKFDYYTAVTLPEIVYLEGNYEFKGWFEDEDCTLTTTGFGAGEMTDDWTFYAKVEATVVLPTTSPITYVLNGGVNASTNPSSYIEGEGVATLAAATKDGYTFEGWYTDSACTNKVTSISATATGSITLYAKWTENATTTPDTTPSTSDSTSDSTPDASSSSDKTSTSSSAETSSCSSSIAGMGIVGAVMALASVAVACKKRKED